MFLFRFAVWHDVAKPAMDVNPRLTQNPGY